MSILIVSMVLYADIPDMEYLHVVNKRSGENEEKIIRVSASVIKSVLVSLADQANDEGFGAYPGVTRLEIKTSLSRLTVTRGLKALRTWEFTNLEGISRSGTNEYRIFTKKLLELQNPISKFYNAELVNSVYHPGKPSLLAVVNPVYQDGKPSLPESSLNVPESSKNTPADAGKKKTQPRTKLKRRKSKSIMALELLENAFAVARNVAPPNWSNGSGAGLQTNWRSPLRVLLNECNGDVGMAEKIVSDVVGEYMLGKKDARFPMVVPRSFKGRFVARAEEVKGSNNTVAVRPEWEQLIIDNNGQIFEWARDMITDETKIGAWIINNPGLNRVPAELLASC